MKFLGSNTGSALVDYIIPTAVVGLVVGLALFTLQNDNLLTNFIAASSGSDVATDDGTLSVGKDDNTTDSQWVTNEVIDASIASGTSPELEGSEEISCAGGVCTIKVGDYTLTSIPEDMAEYIKSTGPSGGEDVIASTLNQVIAQMEADADPSEGPLIAAIKSLAELVGQDKYSAALPFQKASNNYLLETLINNTYSSDPRINVSGNDVNEARTMASVDITSPTLLTMLKSFSDGNNLDSMGFTPVEMAASTASGTNGKDYTALLNTIDYLQKQATSIDSAFLDEVISQSPGTNLASLQTLDLQSVKDNVASKMEDVTAASIIAAAKGEI